METLCLSPPPQAAWLQQALGVALESFGNVTEKSQPALNDTLGSVMRVAWKTASQCRKSQLPWRRREMLLEAVCGSLAPLAPNSLNVV